MIPKKTALNFHNHAEFVRNNSLGIHSAIEGFSVINNGPLVDNDVFRDHFRTDFLTILVITGGEVSFSLNLKKYTGVKNDLIVAAPNAVKQMHKVTSNTTLSVVSFTAGFLGKMGMPDNMTELFDYFTSKFSPLWKLKQKEATFILKLIDELFNRNAMMDKHPYGKELLYHSFQIFLYELKALSMQFAESSSTAVSRKESLVMNFTSLVQKQFKSERNLQQYAQQLFITPKYLTETVKEITGKNAGEIIDNFVVLEAKILLDNPKLSIGEITEMLHFSDQSFFGKYFKRHTGFSPKEFRNSLK